MARVAPVGRPSHALERRCTSGARSELEGRGRERGQGGTDVFQELDRDLGRHDVALRDKPLDRVAQVGPRLPLRSQAVARRQVAEAVFLAFNARLWRGEASSTRRGRVSVSTGSRSSQAELSSSIKKVRGWRVVGARTAAAAAAMRRSGVRVRTARSRSTIVHRRNRGAATAHSSRGAAGGTTPRCKRGAWRVPQRAWRTASLCQSRVGPG